MTDVDRTGSTIPALNRLRPTSFGPKTATIKGQTEQEGEAL